MRGDIERSLPRSSALAGPGSQFAGPGSNIGDLQFTAAAASPLEVPASFFDPQPPSRKLPPLAHAHASGAHTEKKAVRIGGTLYQRREFWHLFDGLLVFHVALRHLQPRPDGKLAPAGSWLNTERTYRSFGPASPQRASSADDAGSTSASAAPAPESGCAGPAALAQSALPGQARAWLVREVPTPVRWLGGVLRWSNGIETIDVLRLDLSRFAAIHAEREIGQERWGLLRLSSMFVGAPETISVAPPGPAEPARRALGSR